jgi:hypothetical protein
MNYPNLKRYASTHIIFLYVLFLLTGLIFFKWGSHLIKAEPEIVVVTDTIPVYFDSTKTHNMFLDAIAYYESGQTTTNGKVVYGNYRKVNNLGYLGKYQFGRTTLKELKITCTPQEFLDQPELQEFAMDEHLRLNKKLLAEYIGKYQFTYYRGIFITESGILAAAHLGGAGSVKKFFKGGTIFKDGNGVPITTYMNSFKEYNLEYK